MSVLGNLIGGLTTSPVLSMHTAALLNIAQGEPGRARAVVADLFVIYL